MIMKETRSSTIEKRQDDKSDFQSFEDEKYGIQRAMKEIKSHSELT